MTRDEARVTIMKAVDDFDGARITRSSLATVVEQTVNDVYNTGFDNGTYSADKDDEVVDFEAEMELDTERDDEDDLDDFRSNT